MVKSKDSWLEAEDSNGVRLNLWLQKDDEYHGYCKLCRCQVKCNTQSAQAFTQHSHRKKHKDISDIRFSPSQVHISGKAEWSTSTEMKKSTSKTMILDASQKDKISSAVAIWMFKFAEQDYSLRLCDDVPKLFLTMSSDGNIAKGFTILRQTVSCIVSDGLQPLLGKRLCNVISSSEGTFTVLFDKTTTVQNKKQMDVLICYWNGSEGLIVT